MPVLARVLSATAAAVLLATAVPLSATAAPHPYTPLKPDTWSVTIHPNTTVTHPVPDATFDDGADLQLTVTGEAPEPTIGTVPASKLPAPAGASTSDGGATVKLDFGPTTRGVYEVTLKQAGTENNSYGVVTVVTDDAALVKQAPADPAPLARTGTSINGGVIWGAASATAVGVLMWITAWWRRRATAR